MSYVTSVKALYIVATSQDTARFKEITASGCNYYPLAHVVALLTVKRDEVERLYLILYRSEFLFHLTHEFSCGSSDDELHL